MTGIEMIAEMRQQQIKDDQSREWHREVFKTTNQDRILALVKAGAVIVEEIERLIALEQSKLDKEKNNG